MILHPLSAVTVALAASLSPQGVQVTPDVGPIHRAPDGAVPDGDPDRIRISGRSGSDPSRICRVGVKPNPKPTAAMVPIKENKDIFR